MKKVFLLALGLLLFSVPVFSQTLPVFTEQCTLDATNTSCNLINEEGMGIGAHQISWTLTGTNSGSSILLQYSDTSQAAGFSTLITGTSTGANESIITNGVHKFWKFTLSGFTATSVGASLNVVHKAFNFTPDTAGILTSLQLLDDSQTGDSVNYRTSAGATEDEAEIKATPGRLFSVALTNTNAAARYFRCYNLTAANTTPGTSPVFLGFAIPGVAAGNSITQNFGPNGIAFSVALTCTLTTGAADTDVAEVAANEIKWVITYK